MKNSSQSRGYIRVGLVAVLVVGVAAGAAAFFLGGRGGTATAGSSGEEEHTTAEPAGQAIRVRAVHAALGKDFSMTVQRPADVTAYYSSELESRVPGVVKWVRSAIGDQVKEGELLIDVDVPDLVQAVVEKEQVVKQREQDRELAKVAIKTAEAALKTAQVNVRLKQAAIKVAEAAMSQKGKLLARLQQLREARSAIDQGAVDDAERDYMVAVADKAAAEAAVDKARSEVDDAQAKLDEARETLKVKKTLIDVAKSDREFAKARRDFAHIKAPFDATVVQRKVDPGDFVQNASSGHPTPLLSLERSDIVTVVMRVPDHYAPYVTPGTEAVLELDSLPGVQVHGKVTRFAPSLVNAEHDRTMRVEVDLWNLSPEQYAAFLKAEKAKNFDDLKKGPLPLVPQFTTRAGTTAKAARLLPGMFGTMTLVLKSFPDARLLPSEAIVSRGGRPYIYVVQDGKAHLQPVDVQVDDGKVAVVELLGADGSVLGNLTGNEVVIISNQGELSEGQPVAPVLATDWRATAPEKKVAAH